MAVLISGCSTGIGYSVAHFLRAKGYHVVASARSEGAVSQLQQEGFNAVMLDVCSSESIKSAVTQACKLAGEEGIDVLINNAGYGQGGALEDISRDMLRRQFETNVFGLLELTNEVLPLMRAQGRGRIINIGSILGLVSLPFRGAYNASKYAVEGLSDTLRLELAYTPIKVSLIEPGPILSQFRDTCINRSLWSLDMTTSHYRRNYEKILLQARKNKKTPFMLPPEAVAHKVYKALRSANPKARYQVTLPALILAQLKRCLSSAWLDKVLLMASRHELEKDK